MVTKCRLSQAAGAVQVIKARRSKSGATCAAWKWGDGAQQSFCFPLSEDKQEEQVNVRTDLCSKSKMRCVSSLWQFVFAMGDAGDGMKLGRVNLLRSGYPRYGINRGC